MEIDGGALTTYSGDYEFYEPAAGAQRKAAAGPVSSASRRCSPRKSSLHRALQGTRQRMQPRCRAASSSWRRSIKRRAAQDASQTVLLRFPGRRRAPARMLRALKNVHKSYGSRSASTRGWTSTFRRQGALVRDGRQRRGQVYAAEAGRWRYGARRRHRRASAPSVKMGYFRPARYGSPRRRTHGVRISRGYQFPQAGQALPARARRLLRLLRRRRSRRSAAYCRAARRPAS